MQFVVIDFVGQAEDYIGNILVRQHNSFWWTCKKHFRHLKMYSLYRNKVPNPLVICQPVVPLVYMMMAVSFVVGNSASELQPAVAPKRIVSS